MLMWVAYTSVWHHVDDHSPYWCHGPYWVLCSYCNSGSSTLPMLPPKAKICAVTWNHIDTHSTFDLEPMLMVLWQCLWSHTVAKGHVDNPEVPGICCCKRLCEYLWSLLFPEILWKSMVHTLADCKWKESYVWCGFNDCRLTVKKEGHVRLLWQSVPLPLHSKRISLDRKL